MSGFDPNTARVEGLAAADSFIVSMDINGKPLPQLSETSVQFRKKLPLRIDRGFVEGINTLEFRVKSRHPGGQGQHQGPPKPMALFVELHGTAKRK